MSLRTFSLPIHALLGCYSESKIFGICNDVALNQPRNCSFNLLTDMFNNRLATTAEIAKAGESALVSR